MENQELEIFKGAIFMSDKDVAIKPCCEAFGIQYRNQIDRIKNDHILAKLVRKNSLVGADGKVREMVCLPIGGFLRWVNTINAGTVADKNRQTFNIFLETIHEYLMGSLNPTMKFEQKQAELYRLNREIQYTEGQIELKKSELADLKEQLKQLKAAFWELFNSNGVQLPLPFNTELP